MPLFKQTEGERPDPAEVFTPARAVGPEMWARRMYAGHSTPEGLQKRFEQRMGEVGRQIVLHGDTGVGKTSLVQHILDTRKVDYIRVECGQPFDTMIKEALAAAGLTEDKFEIVEETSGQAGVKASLGLLFSGLQRSDTNTETKVSYPVSLPTTARVALSTAGVKVLFLDNFENLRAKDHGKETAVEIAQLMKSFSDTGDVKLVVAGIPEESEALLLLDEATSRRTAEIEVPRMSDEELDEILQNGERLLNIEFDADARAAIIRFSDGFPYYTHLLALHATRKALEDGENRVSSAHFVAALGEIIEDASLSLRRAYANAAETSGEVMVRKSIMTAMARSEKSEMTFREIREAFQQIHPQYDDLKKLNFINVDLGKLVERGILQTRGVKKSKDRAYRFVNPLMRTFVRLKAAQEQYDTQMALPTEPQVAPPPELPMPAQEPPRRTE